MRKSLTAISLLATVVGAQDADCIDDDGNWFRLPVHAITYTSVGGSGTYNRVINMDSDNGVCSNEPYSYSGSIAPLNEEVSWHVRGPTILKQFAAYTPHAPFVKRSQAHHKHVRRHARDHEYHVHRIKERQVGATVTATINGVEETWINVYDGSDYGPEPVATLTVTKECASEARMPMSTATGSGGNSAYGNTTSAGNGWGRNAYYHAENQIRDGLVFLNHFGGSGSGVFDYSFGNSLSYASSDGNSGSADPQTLEHTTLPSSAEVVLMRDMECKDDLCGYTRPGTVAHHGWDGARKAFFFEFQMPSDGGTSDNIYDPVNMPAIWMLNAQIPRTLQYGNEDCSCWGSGCGEFDMFEVLSPGSKKAKSTLHGNKAGGDSNYFDRPEDKPIKVGMVMFDDNVHIKILPDDMDFPATMDEETINEILGSTSTASRLVSLFSLAESLND